MKLINGIGKFCLLFTFVSLTYASQRNILNFAVDTKHSTELTFSWDARNVSGRIREFRIECSRRNKSEIIQNKNRINSNTKNYTIKELGSYKKYTCELIVYRYDGTVAARASLDTRTLRGDVCSQPLGLENGALPDEQIEFPKNSNDKKSFRLNSIGNAFNVYTKDVILTFDFKRIIKVTGFAIKSFRNTNIKFYFKYQTFENKNFETIQENSRNDVKEFQNPQGSTYMLRYRFNDSPIIARYIKLIHKNSLTNLYLKVEFYGCSEVCSNLLKHENITLEKNRVVSRISNPELYSNENVSLNRNDSLHYSFCNTVKLSGISVLNKITIRSQKIKLQILCSMNGRNFTAVDQSRLFGGTIDAGDVLTSWLVTEKYCKHIQLILVSPLNICLQVQLLGCQSGCVDKLGIEKNEKGITYTASSYRDASTSASNSPDNGRLNAVRGGWAADKKDTNGKRFWQACLNDITLISGVYVQGLGSYSTYIQKFLVTYSYMDVDKNSNVGLHEYTSNGSLAIFNGTTNRYETHFYKLPTPIYARCLRLYVNCTISDQCGGRFEFGGCKNASLPSPMINWYQAKKILACTISNAQPEDLDWFVFKQKITSNVQKSKYDDVKHGYKKVNVTILASLIPTYRNCFDNKMRKTFYCSAEYSCRANFDGKNSISLSDTQVISVDFIEIPATPANLAVQEIRSTSVKLAFSLNANQKIFPIISYFVRITNGNQSEVKAFKNDSEKIILEMLTPFTNYTVYIKSANEYHNSTEEKVLFQTNESASEPPFNLETFGKYLSWKKPRVANGIISSYFVQCVRSNGSEIISLSVESNKLKTRVNELAPGLKYLCKMRAFTKRDSIPGFWSPEIVMKVVETNLCFYALGMETNVITDQQISASNARLNNNKGWCTSSPGDITIDFGILVTLNGIAMQGNLSTQWSIDVRYAVGDDFQHVWDAKIGQSKRKFYHPGGNITKRHWFEENALTLRKIKIYVDQGMCVKFEFYGCAEICSQRLKPPFAASRNTVETLDIGDVSLSGLLIENHVSYESSVIGEFGVIYKKDISSNWTDLRSSTGEKVFQVNRRVPYTIYWFDIVHIHRLKIKSTIAICINITFLGCHSNCFNKLGIETNIIGLEFSSSSKNGSSQGPEFSQLNRMIGDWSESTTSPVTPSWIQVCLPRSSYITGIALQGQGYWNDGQVNSYQLQYSFDGKQMFNYTQGSQQMKLFQGTKQRYKTQVRLFLKEITARCLRLYTVKCNKLKSCSLRWEILGCHKGGIPRIDKISGQSPVQKGMNGEVESLISAIPGVRINWIFQGTDPSLFPFHTFDWRNNNLTLEGKFMSKIVIDKNISTYIINNDVPCTINKLPMITCHVKYICETYYPFSDGGKAMKQIVVDFQGFNGFIAQPLITLLSYGNTSVSVTWKIQDDHMAHGDFPLYGFEINLTDKSTTLEKIFLNKTTYVNYIFKFENLNPYSKYTISVASYNRLIHSKAVITSFTTLEGVPSQVTDLSVISKTKDSITLRWSAPTPANGIISKYLIEYKQRNESDTVLEEVIDVANVQISKTVKELKNFQYYSLKVKAFTNSGTLSGNWSRWLDIQTDEGKPSQPENIQGKIISKRSYKLTWENPNTLNGILKNFKVSYIGRKIYNNTFRHEGNDISSGKSIIISRLFPGTLYKFTVAGVTRGGVGEKSSINVELPVDIPYNPEILKSRNGMQSITFHLRPVPDLNGPVKFYQTDIQESGNQCFVNSTSKFSFLPSYLPTSIIVMKGLEDVQLPNGGSIQLDLIGKFMLCFRAVTQNGTEYYGNTTSKIFVRSDLKRVTNKSIDIGFKFIKVYLSRGPPTTKYYQIVVAEGNITDFDVDKLTPYIKSQDKPYITAEFLAKDFDEYKVFHIGNNKGFPKVSPSRYRRDIGNQVHYKNQELKPGTLYSVLQIAFQDKETFYTTPWMNAIKTRGTESSNCSSVLDVAKNLMVATANNSIKTPQDLKNITDTIINIIKNINTSDINETRQVVDYILITYNNILDVDQNIIGKSQTVSSSSTDLLLNLDIIANKLRTIINQDKNFSSLQIAQKNIAFDIRSTLRKNITVIGNRQVESTDLQLQIAENNGTNIDKGIIASIEIPSTSFPNDNAIIHTTLFAKPLFFIPGEKLRSISGEDVSTSQFIETSVISFSFGSNITTENLTIPIIIRLNSSHNSQNSTSDGLNVCVFWDFNLPSGVRGIQGDWSTRGCKYAGFDTRTGLSICECDHLTNFALLLDVSQTGHNPLELQIVTWIGCAFSIFGHVMTIISFLIFKKLLKKLPHKILVSLCISLLALLIVFLAGAKQTSTRLGCQIVAGLLHYLMLTTFCWMFIEAISLYRSFITVFKSGSQTKFFWKACAFAWGVPAIIVAITAGFDHEHYGNDRICTIQGNAFYFAVLLPVVLVLAVNTIVLVAVMDVLVRLSSKRRKRLQQHSNPFAAVRIAFACNALLGATWIFAVLVVKDARTTFQWLFCICNSLQGFFIFIFYTVRNKDVRNEWRRLLGLAGKDGAKSRGKSHLTLTATSKKGG